MPFARSTTPVSGSNIKNLTFRRYNTWFNTFSSKTIFSIFEDKKGYIWLGYEDAVVIYDRTRNSFSRIIFESDEQEITLGEVRNIASLDNGKILVAGASILVLNEPWEFIGSKQEVIIPVDSSYLYKDEHNIIAVNIDKPNIIWVGYLNKGLSLFDFDGDSLMMIKHFEYVENNNKSISNNAVFCINKDADQSLWIGTFGGGLNRLEDISRKA